MALYWGGTKGGSQQVDCGNVTVGDSGDMSLCAWVRLPNNFTGAASVIDRRGGSATLHRFWILCVGDGAGGADFRFIRKHTTTDAVAISTQAYSTDDSTWYFVAGTHVAGAAPKLFVGGQTTAMAEVSYSSQTAPAGTLRTGAQPLSLGRQPTNTSTGFGGAIAIVGLFNAALTPAEIESMRRGSFRSILSHPNLDHCWAPMLNGISGTVYDIGAKSIFGGTTINGTMSGTFSQVPNPGTISGFPAIGPAEWRPYAIPSGGQTITGATYSDTDAFGSGSVGTSYAISGAAFSDADAFGSGAVTTAYGITGSALADSDTFGSGTITQGATITGAAHSDPDAFGAGAVTTATTVAGSAHVDADAFGAGSVSQGLVITGTAYADADTFGAGQVATSYTIGGAAHSDPDAFGAGAISASGTITGATFVDPDDFGAGAITTVVTLTGGAFSSQTQFGAGVVVFDQTIVGVSFAGVSTFGAGAIVTGTLSSRRHAAPANSANGGSAAVSANGGTLARTFNSGIIGRG